MKKILVILFIFSSIKSNSQAFGAKEEYKSQNLKTLIKTAKSVAILPFEADISYKKMPKGVNVENIKEEEKALSTQLQEGMLTFLLRKSKDYTVEFQDINRTNALLKKQVYLIL